MAHGLPIKMILLGDPGVGKTSLLRRLMGKEFFKTYRETNDIAVDIVTERPVVCDRLVEVNIWDMVARENKASFNPIHCRDADGCVLVLDVTYLGSFHSLDKWRDLALRYVTHDPHSFPIIVMANKADVWHKEVKKQAIHDWCQRNGGIPVFHSSAKTNTNVRKALDLVTELAVRRKVGIVDQSDSTSNRVNVRQSRPRWKPFSCC